MVIKSVSSNIFNPIVSAARMVVRGPERVFANWLATSQYNDSINVKALNTRINCVSLSKQFVDRTFRLNVKKGKETSGRFEEDSKINDPTHYMVDDQVVVSKKEEKKRTHGEIAPDVIDIRNVGGGWNPSSITEHEIQGSVKQWIGQQMTLTGLVSLLEQLAAIGIVPFAYDETGIKNRFLVICAAILQISALINTYRLYQLGEIEGRSIPTLGHWAAEIRRYAYSLGSSYAQYPNVKKYLAENEMSFLRGAKNNPNEGRVLDPSNSTLPDIEELRKQRITHFELPDPYLEI